MTELSNFRPITTLSIYSKIFEKLVHKRLVSFISQYSLIKPNQFGFQANKSTSDALLEFLENIHDSFNENKNYIGIFLDFSKAFDTICHRILLKKIEHMGFRGPIYQWISSYLTNRKQFVNMGDVSSDTLDIKMGVPQGSTLGPLLFILYINDMSNSLSVLKVVHFADDSTLHISAEKNQNNATEINNELEAINSWLTANKLYLNIDKTKYMIFSLKEKPPDLNLIIGNSLIERTNVQKFLGIYIDDKINFGEHTKKLSAQLARSVGVLRRMKLFLPQDVLKQLFYAFIYSKYTYGIVCYGSTHQNKLQKVKNLINKAMKLVLNASSISAELLKKEKILDFDLSYKYFSSINMYKILCLNTHAYFANKIHASQINRTHQTRAVTNQNLYLPRFLRKKYKRSFIYKGSQFWNSIPINIRNIDNNCNTFKRSLKNHLLS